jgi:DNA-binding MarR family transcriptional regulator
MRVIAATTDCRVQELANGLGLTVGAASKAVDRLEGKGWAERVAHPSDRRSSILRLTAEGRRMLAAGERVAGEVMAQRLGQGLEPREVAELARLLARVRASTAGRAMREGDADAAARGAS